MFIGNQKKQRKSNRFQLLFEPIKKKKKEKKTRRTPLTAKEEQNVTAN